MAKVAPEYEERVLPEVETVTKAILNAARKLEESFALYQLENSEICCCPYQLRNAAISALYDIMRYKDFHGSPEPNDIKKAAYICYWVAKVRPFYIEVNEEDFEKKEHLYSFTTSVNAYVCLFILDVFFSQEDWPDKLPISFIYDLNFGHHSSGSIITIFEALSS